MGGNNDKDLAKENQRPRSIYAEGGNDKQKTGV